MSVENGKVCCNCRHNSRQVVTVHPSRIECHCDLDNHYIGYIECMEYWCRHWAKERDKVGEENEYA